MRPTSSSARWIELPTIVDDRGRLTAVESDKTIPFRIRRVFYVHHVRRGRSRGGHAHRDTHQIAIAVAGAFQIEVSDGRDRITFQLTRPDRGLYIPPMLFARLKDFGDGAVCLVLASTPYDVTRSIRSWEAYVSELGHARQTARRGA